MLQKLVRPLVSWTRPSPLSASALAKQAERLTADRHWHAAASVYERVLATDRADAESWARLGYCLREGGNRDAAVEAYRAASRLTSDVEAHRPIAQVLQQLGDKDGAFDAFYRSYALTADPIAAVELSKSIGTSSPWADVDRAVREGLDTDYYAQANWDVRTSNTDPVIHYLRFGWREGRAPSRVFDPAFYASRFVRLLRKDEMPLVHFITVGRSLGLRGNGLGEETWFEPTAPDDAAWEHVQPARFEAKVRAVVVLPVYRGYDETLAAVHHALTARGASPYSLLVVNDCGPDAALNAVLARLADQGLFDYHLSAVNRGFVKTVNLALRRFSGDKDVVLLNSDAYVFPGWFERLVAHADRDPLVATVTPLSNNATLCSYPMIDRDNRLALEIAPADLDQMAARVNPGRAIEAPTGVGFCFYMRRSVIDAIGALDDVAFKVGYGEENDFCMRALNAGYKNLIAADVFVYHVGSVSFSTTKAANFDAGQAALIGKHPNYTELTQRFMAADPCWEVRHRMDLERLLATMRNGIVFVTHRWKGGIDTYLDSMIDRLPDGAPYIVLRVHDRHRVTLETDARSGLFVPNLASMDLRVHAESLRCLFDPAVIGSIHVNSLVGLDWANHRLMLELIRTSGVAYTYVGHDYSSISHNYELLPLDGIHRGLPTSDSLALWDSGRSDRREDRCDLVERRAVYAAFFEGAARCEAPSQAAAAIFRTYFPDCVFHVVPHPDHLPPVEPISRRQPDGRLLVAVVGAIGPHKGSDVLLALARDIRFRSLPIDIRIVGYTDKDEAFDAEGVTVSGGYGRETEALEILANLQPDLFFVPSIWAETYCYTLSMAMALGIPPVAFDLGAQAERIHALGWGHVLDPMLINRPTALADQLLDLDVNGLWERRPGGGRTRITRAVGS